MEWIGLGDGISRGGGGGRSREVLLMSEASSQQRTTRARAHAAQYLMMDSDNACMPLLPDDPGKRISLYRQIRGRYNPTQIPLSSFSCAAYLGAGDVAQLAALFREFSLFSNEVVNTLDTDDGSGSSSNAEGKAKVVVGVTEVNAKARTTKSAVALPGHEGKATPRSTSRAQPAVGTPDPSPPAVADAVQGKAGMGLLRCVAQRPPRALVASERPLVPSPPSVAGALTTAAGETALSLPPAPPAARKAVAGPTAPTVPKVTAVDRREVAEPFTTESCDSALTMGWLVEVLWEMVIANSAQSTRFSGGCGGAVATAAVIASEPTPMPPSGPLPESKPDTGDYHLYCNAAVENGGAAHGAATCFNTAANAIHHARRRNARLDQLRHFKAELTLWAEHLAQKCDEREHRALWQQCVAQEEVLERYQACVLHSQAPRVMGTQSAVTPGSAAAALSPRAKVLSFANFEAATTPTSGKAAINTSPRRGGAGGARGNVSWGVPYVDDSAGAAAAPTLAERGVLCPSPLSSAIGPIKLLTSPQTCILSATEQQRPQEMCAHTDMSDAAEVLSMRNNESGGGLAHPSPSTELLQSTVSSFTGSATLLPPNASGMVAGVTSPTVSASVTGMGSATADRNLLAAKAQLAAPALKDLLLQPAQLYAFLWTSSAASRLAEEKKRDKHRNHQRVRMARGTQPSTSHGGDRSAGGSSMSPTGTPLSPRRSRAAPVQHLVCWSDVVGNLLMELETPWVLQRHDSAYTRVPTALLEDATAIVGPRSFSGAREDDGDDDDSVDDGLGLGGGAGNGAGMAGSGRSRQRRQHKSDFGNEAAALQQRAMLFNSLGAAAESTLGVLHSQSADQILACPTQRYVVTSSKDGLLKVWDTTCGRFVSTIMNVGQSWVLAMTFLHGGEFLMVATSAAEITVVNFPAGGVLLKLRGCTSLATAVPQVKQPSTLFTKRYGLKPGECGRHKPTRSDGGGLLGAAAAARVMEYTERESEPIVARPIVGYVTPTAAYYDAETSFFFFGTMSGMIGCVDLAAVLSRTALHAAAASAGWAYPLQVYGSAFAHPGMRQPKVGAAAPPASEMPLQSPEAAATSSRSPIAACRKTRATPSFSAAASGATGAASGGVPVNRLFYCSVGHCIISSDPDGGVMRTPFTTAADTLDYALGAPTVVMETAKPIRFMVSCASGRRFVTVHSDRRAFLWAVGRTLTECVHQYPQEAYDIISVCFMPPRQQVSILMADHSIRVYDERGSRPLTSIQPPRGLSSRVEDIASVTLKCSANDVDGCLTYLPAMQRLVCGLRGPVLYEPAARAPPRSGTSVDIAMDLEASAGPDVLERKKAAPNDAAAAAKEARSPSSAAALSLESSLLLPPLPQATLSFYAPTSGSHEATKQATVLASRRQCDASVSMSSFAEVGTRDLESSTTSTEAKKGRQQRQVKAALQKYHQRLQPHQAHSSAVIGLLLDAERGELHSFSTDMWCVWCYETGKRLRAPLHVPHAAEKELVVGGRRALLTCCSWSTEGRTRVLVGTRDSRVLTLDARVGSVISSTDPFTQSARGPTSGACSPALLADKDISAIACSGSRTLLCSGHVCEVRRYDAASVPQPNGEEKFISMRVELPSDSPAAMPSSAQGVGTGVTLTSATTAAAKDTKSSTSAARGGCIDTTITACCVVRESHLCLGTTDTQLFFYRMVDRSSPLHVEVLCDAHGVPDVGRIVSLKYLDGPGQDMLLAVVDTGVLFVYSYTLQRTLGRYTFPVLGSGVPSTAPLVPTPRGQMRDSQQHEHYITSVDLARGVLGSPQLSLLTMACGDSAGHVHVVPLAQLLSEASSAASREGGMNGAARVPKSHELRVLASFPASRGGVSSLAALGINPNWRPTVGMPCHGAVAPPSSELTQADGDGYADASSTAPVVLSIAPFAEPHLLVFAAGFDGSVRVFRMCAGAPPQQDLVAGHPYALSSFAGGRSSVVTQLHLHLPTVPHRSYTKMSHIRAPLSIPLGQSASFRTVGGGGASALSSTLAAARYEVTAVGLCGVDTWDLGDSRTFSDDAQAMVIAQAHSNGSLDAVLPFILGDADDRKGTVDAGGATVNIASATGECMAALDAASTTAKKASGALLLYDILRRSKKQKPGSPTIPAGNDAEQLPHQPRPAAANVGATADGAPLRQCGGAPVSRSPTSPPSRSVAPPATTAAVAGPRAATAWPSKEDTGLSDGPVRYPGWCANAAPPAPPPPTPPPVHFTPHTIGELVRDALPSSWSRSPTATGIAAALSSTPDSPMHDATDDMCDGATGHILSPIPYPQAKQNALVRVYPVSLLRHMGLLHPLDTTPDADPDTGLPVLISAHEAFKPWEARWLRAESISTATALPLLMRTSLTTSAKSAALALASAEASTLASVVAPSGSDVVINVPQCAFSQSSLLSLSAPSGLRRPRRMTAAAWPTPLSLISDLAERETEVDEAHQGSRSSGDGETDAPTFLTEGGAEWTPPRALPATHASSLSSPAAAAVERTSVVSRCSTTVEDTAATSGAPVPQGPQGTDTRTSLITGWAAAPGAIRDGWEALPRRPTAAHPSTALARPNRSRTLLLPPAPPTVAQSLGKQKVAYLRDALEGVDENVLRWREDQMMLAHIASQLDLSRQAPRPPCANAAATADGAISGSPKEAIPTLGAYTSQLIRLWRQRAGDAMVAAVAAAFRIVGTEEATEASGGASAQDAGANTNAGVAATVAMSRTTTTRLRAAKMGNGRWPTRRPNTSGNRVARKVRASPRQREPAVTLPSSRPKGQGSHGKVLNPIAAYTSFLQERRTAAFGLELLALSVPSEPQTAPTRVQRRTDRGADALSSTRATAPSYGWRSRPGMPAAATTARPSKAAPHLEARLPMIAVQQEVQPIRVSLPSTLCKDEGERMWLRRFEAAFNSADNSSSR
ncbi:hypothetical protein LSCM1_05104 [Leishmania martiniquensis]|uniref:Guanine nucleotide-binding protein subunit beta-like protein n=1 Tax=Leishmania martiniquensis TaxID=1580590 RepID=A0A836GRU7_9TRYP|nr:hypothetical protein LSCM1_05104 [Leishmania martiniquensis]